MVNKSLIVHLRWTISATGMNDKCRELFMLPHIQWNIHASYSGMWLLWEKPVLCAYYSLAATNKLSSRSFSSVLFTHSIHQLLKSWSRPMLPMGHEANACMDMFYVES